MVGENIFSTKERPHGKRSTSESRRKFQDETVGL